jgi:predicted RNA-binding protein
MKYWLAVGTPKNWLTSFELGNAWGLKGKGPQATAWQHLAVGDVLLFYAVAPVRGIIGYGVVQQKLKQNAPLWSDEVEQGEVIWPLRLVFEITYCLPPDRWKEEKIVNDSVNFRAKMGFRQLPEDIATVALAPLRVQASPEQEMTIHNQLIELLLEIGRLQSYLCDKEYRMGRARLDAVWRRVQVSVPNYVFEVQIGGNPYQALAKLKHAYDLWNSNIYLVVQNADVAGVEELLSGTFHEIKGKLSLVDEDTIRRLVDLKREVRGIEAKMGLVLPAS